MTKLKNTTCTLAPTEADRYNSDKPMLSLVPLAGMEAFARAGMNGLEKYSRDNWRKGLPLNEVADSLLRHLMRLLDPDQPDTDIESGLHEADHIAWNAFVLAHGIKHNWPLNREGNKDG